MFFASGRQPLADATVIRRGCDIVRDAFYFVCCCPHGNSAAATVAAKVNLVPLMEVHEQLDQARKDIAEGKGFAVDGKEALASLLESIWMYTPTFAPQALEGLAKLKKSEPATLLRKMLSRQTYCLHMVIMMTNNPSL